MKRIILLAVLTAITVFASGCENFGTNITTDQPPSSVAVGDQDEIPLENPGDIIAKDDTGNSAFVYSGMISADRFDITNWYDKADNDAATVLLHYSTKPGTKIQLFNHSYTVEKADFQNNTVVLKREN